MSRYRNARHIRTSTTCPKAERLGIIVARLSRVKQKKHIRTAIMCESMRARNKKKKVKLASPGNQSQKGQRLNSIAGV